MCLRTDVDGVIDPSCDWPAEFETWCDECRQELREHGEVDTDG